MKNRHNKKRNTAFLYETLVRELTKATISEDKVRYNKTLKTIKHFFKNGTAIRSELNCYKDLNETFEISERNATRLLEETIKTHNKINKKQLFNEQTSLIKAINKHLGHETFSTFIPNYRNLATIFQMFSETTPNKTKIVLEEQMIKKLTLPEASLEEQKLEPISLLAYKQFVKKFNTEYKELLPEQQTLLNKYVASMADDGIDFKVYLNEEIGRLKDCVKEVKLLKEVKDDQDMLDKTNNVSELLNSFKDVPINIDMVETVLRIQHLIGEATNND